MAGRLIRGHQVLRNRCMSDGADLGAYVFPPLAGGQAVLRTEDQRWSRQGRADGVLTIGYQRAISRCTEYHWWRWFGRADPRAEDVTQRNYGYAGLSVIGVIYCTRDRRAALVDHDRLRPVLLQASGWISPINPFPANGNFPLFIGVYDGCCRAHYTGNPESERCVCPRLCGKPDGA